MSNKDDDEILEEGEVHEKEFKGIEEEDEELIEEDLVLPAVDVHSWADEDEEEDVLGMFGMHLVDEEEQ